MTLKFAEKDCKFFAYLAVSLSGPQFDYNTKIHLIQKDKTVKLEGINQTCIYVKYPLETYFLMEMRSNLDCIENGSLVQAHHFNYNDYGRKKLDVSRIFWGRESDSNNDICEFNLTEEKDEYGCLIFSKT